MRKLLGITLIAGGLFYYVGRNKVDEYSKAVEKIKAKFLGIKDVNLSGGNLLFKTNIELQNASVTDISFDTGEYLTLNRILFYTKTGNYIGEANPNISNIDLPAHSKVKIENIPTLLPLKDFGSLLNNALEILDDSSSLKLKLEFTALGKTFLVEA